MRKYSAGRWYTCRPFGPAGVYYIFWSENRRSRRTSTGTTSVHEAQAFFDEWLTLEAALPADATCADLWPVKYPEGENVRADAAWKHLEPVFGPRRVSSLTDRDDRGYVAARRKAGAAASTIWAELAMLRASWNYAIREKVLPPEAKPDLGPLPRQSPPRSRWLTEDEIERLLSAAREWDAGPRVYRFLVLALYTGARRQAICDLKWDQVDWQTNTIHYLPDGEVQTRKRRASVPISAKLRAVLLEAYETRRDAYVIGAGGKINQAVGRVAAKAGVEGVTPHVLRHTAATRMARAGVPLWQIANVLGNELAQIEKVYAKWQPDAGRAAVELI